MDKFRGKSLEGNLLGDSPGRNVIIYLPPSYDTAPDRHYPAVYLLHGNTSWRAGAFNPSTLWTEGMFQGMNIKISMESLIFHKDVGEMILVMPDGRSRYRGSHYVNSAVTGNWADYIVRDLVQHIDRNYRTLPYAQSRGLAGHSMGGRGTMYIGMTCPGVFGALYGMSSGQMDFDLWFSQHPKKKWWRRLLALKEFSQADERMVRMIGLSAAFAPNPERPPFFFASFGI